MWAKIARLHFVESLNLLESLNQCKGIALPIEAKQTADVIVMRGEDFQALNKNPCDFSCHVTNDDDVVVVVMIISRCC